MTVTEQSTNPEDFSQAAGSGAEPELDVFGRAPKGRLNWSHRKGEPRTFALLWMMYLMVASLLMVSTIAAVQSVSPGVVRPAARAMILTAAIGLTLLWPMVRLSQLRPKGSALGAIAADLIVLLPPMAALVLPQTLTMLANWPWSVVIAVLVGLCGWGALLGAVLALALRTLGHAGSDAWHRSLWMLLIIALVFAAPSYHTLAQTAGPAPNPISAQPLPGSGLSPISLVSDLLSDRAAMGRSAKVGPGHWALILRVWAVALAFWSAGLIAMLARPARRA